MDAQANLPVESLLNALGAACADGRISAQTQQNASRWLTEPEYEAFRTEIATAIERSAWVELEAAFWEIIPFGTGGRRGPMSPYGTATINRRTIAESAQGLAVYAKQSTGKVQPRAVVACDTRHRSAEFARLTATTLVANGLEVFLCESPRSTPELSFAVRHLDCDVGVMISASHNPPADNGFKAYWSHGGQVLPPHDHGIIQAVLAVKAINSLTIEQAFHAGRLTVVGQELDQAYVAHVADLSLSRAREIRILFSPLHGVGETNVYAVLRHAGFQHVEVYEAQRQQDGGFPNVPDHLPNPERVAVFGPAVDAAAPEVDLVMASDPDADRLGVVARSKLGGWDYLNGNEVAGLITDYVLRKRTEKRSLTPQHYVLETFVTTSLVSRIARAAGVQVIDDLPVGFKYIGQYVEEHGADRFLLGCEESLGYLAGGYARDKDAAVAGLYVAELAAELKQQGLTLAEQLDRLSVQHGLHLEVLHTETCQGARGQEQIARIMQQLRDAPPLQFGTVALQEVADYQRHERRRLPGNDKFADLPQPAGNMLRLVGNADGTDVWVTIRPSGTEPKLKFYFAACCPVVTAETLPAAKLAIRKLVAGFRDQLVEWLRTVPAD